MKESILCQRCGVEAPTKYVEFHQNIGMLVMRRSQVLRGCLCKKCIHSNFWKMTGTTLGVGWLGTISIILAPFLIINNVIRYIGAAGLGATPPGAARPSVSNEQIARMFPLVPTLFKRVNAGESLVKVIRQLAPQANVTPGQLMVYVAEVSRAKAAARQMNTTMQTGGFPVIPSGAGALPPLPME